MVVCFVLWLYVFIMVVCFVLWLYVLYYCFMFCIMVVCLVSWLYVLYYGCMFCIMVVCFYYGCMFFTMVVCFIMVVFCIMVVCFVLWLYVLYYGRTFCIMVVCSVYFRLILQVTILNVMFMHSYCYVCSVLYILFASCQLALFGYPDWDFLRAFSSVVRQMPGYTSQRRGTARTLPSYWIVLFYVPFVCKCVQYYCHQVATQLQLTNISYHIITLMLTNSAVTNDHYLAFTQNCVSDGFLFQLNSAHTWHASERNVNHISWIPASTVPESDRNAVHQIFTQLEEGWKLHQIFNPPNLLSSYSAVPQHQALRDLRL
jgi:hypothetical protein